MNSNNINSLHRNCNALLKAFKSGMLGQTIMPEDSHPDFINQEERLAYFTLPMALNYQRDSYKLWESALKTYNDPETKFVFDIEQVSKKSEDEVRTALMKYKVALQPNKHVNSWRVIAKTIYENWGSIENLFETNQNDFLKLKEIIKVEYKKGFPYLSGTTSDLSIVLSLDYGIKIINGETIETQDKEPVLAFFLLKLIEKLRGLGSVPALEVNKYLGLI